MLEKTILFLSIALFSICAGADTAPDTDLKTIMQGLRNDTFLVLDGLLIEDYDGIANAAEKIADHPKIPPEQVAQVVAELGAQMAAFKQFDTAVHDLSLAIRSAALEKDRGRTIANYQQMVSACLACHTSFRQRVSTVLNSAQDSE